MRVSPSKKYGTPSKRCHLIVPRARMGSTVYSSYKVAWPIIKQDVVNALNMLWSLDARSFHLLNDALMILLRKNLALSRLKDFRSNALIHSFSKLFTKFLARRLAPRLKDMVALNQSAFIKGWVIHNNFRPYNWHVSGYIRRISPRCSLRCTSPRRLTRSLGRSSSRCFNTLASLSVGPTRSPSFYRQHAPESL
jgi:hypothetical protein